ncbi:Chromosome partition protein Smc [compost metagenome]
MSKKNYEVKFELNGEIDPRLMRSFDDLSRDVTGLEKDLGQLRRTKGLDKLTQEADEAKGVFHDLRKNAKEFGEVFEKTLQFTGAHKIITTVGDMFSNMVSEVGALDDSVHQMGAATGATVEEMAQFKDITQEIYRGNLGEGFNDIANTLVHVRQVTGQAGDTLEDTTKSALIYRDVFGEDIAESIKAVDTMMKNFGITSEQSYNLLAQGAQKGLNKSGELLDTANEYSPLFAKLGFSANGMFDTFSAGLEAGAFNLDKVGDGIKEFGIRTKDGSKQSLEAYKAIGLDGKEMTAQFAAGGDMAQKAFLKTVKAINSVQDPVKRNTAAVQLFGTQAEDLEDRVINSYGNIQKQFDMTADTMKQIEEVRYSSVTKDIQKLGRELMDSVVIPIGEDLMPVLQNLVAWASENKDVIKTLALGVPAGMLTKNAVSMGKDFTKVGKTLLGTTNNVGKFAGAVGLLTNPVGLAVGAVGALTLGVIAYKKHQKAARQELINMGDALDKAYDDYTAVDTQTRKTRDLITEYDRLTTKIKNSKTPANELTEARRKLSIVEEELIELNPDILRAEDAKSDRFREQLGLADQLNESRSEMQRRELEMSVIAGEADLPKLESEYDRLIEKQRELNSTYEKSKESYAQFTEYVNRQQAILTDATLTELQRSIELRELSDEIKEDTGKNVGPGLQDLRFVTEQYKNAIQESGKAIKSTEDDIEKTNQNFESLYDNQKKLIDLDLGGEISDQASKYKDLSEAEKKRFDTAMQDLSELNRAMDMLPDAKKVNIELIWQQTGAIPDFSTPAGKKLKQIQLRDPGFEGYADGGIANKPSIFGEAGPEIAIPLNNKPRSQGLLDTANKLIGRSGEGYRNEQGGTWASVFNMNITVNGNADKQVIVAAARDSYKEWENNLRAYNRQQQRVSFN